VGDHASVDHAFTVADIATFARLSGDDNPIHLDEEAARAAGFEGVIAHGAMVMGLFSRLLGTRLPGPGTIYLGQETRFSRPVYPGATVTAHVEVVAVREDKPVVTLRTWAEVEGMVAMDGQATVLVRPVSSPEGGAA
jgi:3-hydroxybutyryl-CoA dehydratase